MRDGNGSGLMNAYQTSDGWAYIASNNDAMWGRVCEAMSRPDWLADERFSTRAGRNEHGHELEAELAGWFRARSTREAVDYLSGFSVPCAPVNSVEEAAIDPHVSEREIMVEVPDPQAGTMHVTGKMVKFSRTPMVVGSAPLVGEHTGEILRDLLGYSAEQVSELEDGGVVRRAGQTTPSG